MDDPIYFYTKTDEWFELSNFYPQGFTEDGVYWPSVEHYFQAQKFPGEENAEYRERIRQCSTPQQAKTLGRTQHIAIRADWEACKEDVMAHALLQKFRHPKLRELLLSTGHRPLVEKSPFDLYWGSGKHGEGRNRLGELLGRVRETLRNV